MIRAGELDRRVALLTPVHSTDSLGGPTVTWSEVLDVWAKVTDLTGRELIAAQQVNSEITTRFLIRYRTGLSTKMRVRFRNRDYDILAMPEVGNRDEGIQILAKART